MAIYISRNKKFIQPQSHDWYSYPFVKILLCNHDTLHYNSLFYENNELIKIHRSIIRSLIKQK